MGLTPMTVLLACALVVRNCRVLDAFEKRQADDERRRAAGLGPKTRRRSAPDYRSSPRRGAERTSIGAELSSAAVRVGWA